MYKYVFRQSHMCVETLDSCSCFPFDTGAQAAKTLSWHMASETKSTLKGSPRGIMRLVRHPYNAAHVLLQWFEQKQSCNCLILQHWGHKNKWKSNRSIRPIRYGNVQIVLIDVFTFQKFSLLSDSLHLVDGENYQRMKSTPASRVAMQTLGVTRRVFSEFSSCILPIFVLFIRISSHKETIHIF